MINKRKRGQIIMKPLNQYTTEELQQELKNRQNPSDMENQLQETNKFLVEKGIKQHEGKAVTIWADSLFILLEAIKGDRNAVEYHITQDNLHFQDKNVHSLLESAVAEAEDVLSSLNPEREINNILNIGNDSEVIHSVTLEDITNAIDDMYVDNEINDNDVKNLTMKDHQNIITEILGEPIEDLRTSFIPANAYRIHVLIQNHIKSTIKKVIKK